MTWAHRYGHVSKLDTTKHNFPDQSANILRIPLGDKPIFYEWGAVEVHYDQN